jgi:nucleotide-binding universal stress UspA family protein
MTLFQKILVPVDFSVHSEEAVRIASDIAIQYAGSLTLVYVCEPLTYPLPDGYVLFTQMQLDGMFAQFEKQLQTVKSSVEAAGVGHVEARLLQGFAGTEIPAFADKEGFRLIVMGTHGRGGISHLVLGSVAESVVRSAPCPVLTVRVAAPAPQAT